MLTTRLATGLTLVLVLLAILAGDEWFYPWYPLWFVASTLVMTLCAIEVAGLLAASGSGPSMATVVGGILALVVANWVPHLVEPLTGEVSQSPAITEDLAASVHVMAWPLWSFVAILMGTFLIESIRFRHPGSTMTTIAATVLVLSYVGLLGGFIIQMRWLAGPYHGLILLAMFFATAKGSDIGAYTVGRIAGRNKLWPTLSPNKTIEGSVGGLAFGTLAALGVTSLARFVLHAPCLGWGATVGFGLLVAFVAQLGDLMESMIKRDSERKDSSSSVPGFGGLLDVLDSLLFSAPVAYGYWVWFGP